MWSSTNICLELGDYKIHLEVAVAEEGTLPYPAILGRDVPGMKLTMKMEPAVEALPVMTRAAAKRREEQQKADEKATVDSGASPVPLEDLPDLEELEQQEDHKSLNNEQEDTAHESADSDPEDEDLNKGEHDQDDN